MNCNITKEDLLNLVKNGERKSIIFGNGFTLGCKNTNYQPFEAFFYPSLLDKVRDSISKDIKSPHAQMISKLISQHKSSNAEYYIDMFETLIKATGFFQGTDYLIKPESITIDILTEHKKYLHDKLIAELRLVHPENYGEIIEKLKTQFDSAANFLGRIHRIYTLNYDLLLYWLIQHYNSNDENKNHRFMDGYSTKNNNLLPQELDKNILQWSPQNNLYNVHFLHGAIHLVNIPSKAATGKIIRKNSYSTLVQVIDTLNEQYDSLNSLIVLEGTSESKIKLINQNAYLGSGLSRLAKLDATELLIIYGCAIVNEQGALNNDNHIWSRMMNSSVKRIYISIHKPFDSTEFKETAENIKKELNSILYDKDKYKMIYFFSSLDMNIWEYK